MISYLQVDNLSKRFGEQLLFENISFGIGKGQKVALIAKNGMGKSTLLRIIAGKDTSESGTVIFRNDITVGILDQDPALDPENSVFEEVFHSDSPVLKLIKAYEEAVAHNHTEALEKLIPEMDIHSAWDYDTTIKQILSELKIDTYDKKIGQLSGGQKKRVGLAKVLISNPDFLILDEPTNHLDIETIAWLENYLVNYQGALIIVSHDRYFLDKVATVTLDLTRHSLDRYVGNYSKFMDLKAEKLATEAKNFEKQQKEIAKLEDFVNRNIVRASTTKRAQARRKQLEKMERLDKPTEGQKSANMTFHADKISGNVVLTVRDAAIGYDDEILSEPISLDVKKMDAIAIVGPNGIGKTTFIKSVVGKLPFIKGTSTYGANVEVGYYDQTQSALTPSNTVLDELWNDFATTPEVEIRNRLGAFLFSGDDVKKSVSMLSGGEKARLLLAKLSMENNNFLILDEPTNNLDIQSIEIITSMIRAYRGTILLISHDAYFIRELGIHQIITTFAGRLKTNL